MKKFQNFLSVLIVGIITILGIYTVCIFNVSNFLKEDSLKKAVEKLDLTEVLNNNGEKKDVDIQNSMMDRIYDMAESTNVPKEQVDLILHSEAMKEFASDYFVNIATYITTGVEKNMTGIELTEMVRNNIDVFSNQMDDSMKQAIISGVEQHADEIVTLLPSPKTVTENIDRNQLKEIRGLLGRNVKSKLLWGLGGLTLLLVFIQFSWWKWLSWHSAGVAITGITSCILGFIITPVINGLLLDYNEVKILSLLQHFTDILSRNFYMVGGVLLLVAFIEVSIFVNIRHYLKQKEVSRAKELLEEQSKTIS